MTKIPPPVASGEPGSWENPVPGPPPGLPGRVVQISLGDVVLWREGEELTEEERKFRHREALKRLGFRCDGQPQRYAGEE